LIERDRYHFIRKRCAFFIGNKGMQQRQTVLASRNSNSHAIAGPKHRKAAHCPAHCVENLVVDIHSLRKLYLAVCIRVIRSAGGQVNAESSSLSDSALYIDMPGVGLYNAANHRKSQAYSRYVVPGAPHSSKRFEYMRKLFFGNPHPVV